MVRAPPRNGEPEHLRLLALSATAYVAQVKRKSRHNCATYIREVEVETTNFLSNSRDIGCGCGGAAFHMIEARNAGHVIGFDTEPLVIERANQLAIEKNISNQVTF